MVSSTVIPYRTITKPFVEGWCRMVGGEEENKNKVDLLKFLSFLYRVQILCRLTLQSRSTSHVLHVRESGRWALRCIWKQVDYYYLDAVDSILLEIARW